MESTSDYPRRQGAAVGRSPSDTFRLTSPDGTTLPTHEVVVPIAVQLGSPRHLEAVGTGFFVANTGVIATAAHVTLDADKVLKSGNGGGIFVVQYIPGPQYTMRKIEQWIRHPSSDVALGILEPLAPSESGQQSEDPFLAVVATVLEKNARIATFAYPDIVAQSEPGKPLKLSCNPEFYEGAVIEYFSIRRDSVMLTWPCYHTSMYIHGGASGGPVFDDSGHVVGVNCSQFEGEHESADSHITESRALLELLDQNVSIEHRPFEKACRLERLKT